jgi:hypothetical protein
MISVIWLVASGLMHAAHGTWEQLCRKVLLDGVQAYEEHRSTTDPVMIPGAAGSDKHGSSTSFGWQPAAAGCCSTV